MFITTTTLLPLFLYLFVFACLSSSVSTQRVAAKNNMIRCIERERLALLDFKHGLVDDYGLLSSWGSDDECCIWWGVHCDNNTGHITILDLHPPNYQWLKGHKVSPSLLELKHLNYLDLSFNDFQGSRIPEFIGSFKRLRVLSLMDAGFSGTIPPQLGNLTNLRVLNISGYYLTLKIKNFEWLSLLSSLRSIYLSSVDIDLIESSKTSVTLPPFLEELQLPFCQLHGSLPFSLNSSSPFLSVVDFSFNYINTSSLFHLLRNASKKLTSIDLSANYFADTIPDHAFGDMEFLESLYLDSIITNGIPKSFWNLTHLQILTLCDNYQLNASIAELFQKLLKDAEKSLQILDLSWSQFTGELPADIITRFTSLRELRANNNQLNGSNFRLPANVLSLRVLDLSQNQITGQIPDISHALSLRELHLTGNQITGQIPDLSHALSLRALYLSGNQITGQIPNLSHALSLRELYLSDNQITGLIPDPSHTLNLRVLDLSENQLHGGLPETIGKLSKLNKLYASSNLLEGVVTEAHFSNLTHLQFLDLSFNVALSFNMDHLEVLDLSRNKLSDEIPIVLARLNYLAVLDLSSNFLSGKIPIGTQLQSFNASSYAGNIGLCGTHFPNAPRIFLHKTKTMTFKNMIVF
nr:LRR receptor-like serine/threonine-protein kinase GSO1 [Ipomoea batatas]